MIQPNSHAYPKPIGPWERRLAQGVIRQISLAELRGWIVTEDDRLLVIDKPGDLVCHPSKDGPWSSLAGAVREYLGGGAAHLVFRLDRETSGLVLFAKDPAMARRLQMAAQERKYDKTYVALLVGELSDTVTIDRALGPDFGSPVLVKSIVKDDGSGQSALTHFTPLSIAKGFTLARVVTETGRKHQIRAHASAIGFPVVGDKIYGPDPQLFLDFIETGWTDALASRLLMPRQALHCGEIDLRKAGIDRCFSAPLAPDMVAFCATYGLVAKG